MIELNSLVNVEERSFRRRVRRLRGGYAIDVLAYQWGWEFSYGEASVTTEEPLVLPADKNVTFRLRQVDEQASPQLGVRTPHRTYEDSPDPRSEPGEVPAYCAETCGAGHSKMDATSSSRTGGYDAGWKIRRPQPGRSTYRCAAQYRSSSSSSVWLCDSRGNSPDSTASMYSSTASATSPRTSPNCSANGGWTPRGRPRR